MFKAVFLIAGGGTRLRPLTNDRPKSLIEINGKALLARSLNYLKANGINDLVIVTGYMETSIYEFFEKNYPDFNIQYISNEVYDKTNNSYSLYLAGQAFDNEGMLLLDGDILYQKEILDQLLETDDETNILAVRASEDLADEEMKVILNGLKQVAEIDKTLDPAKSYGESLGIAKFSAEFTKKLFTVLEKRMIELELVNEYYEASFQELIHDGEIIKISDTKNYVCCEIDTIEDLDYAAKEVAPFVDG